MQHGKITSEFTFLNSLMPLKYENPPKTSLLINQLFIPIEFFLIVSKPQSKDEVTHKTKKLLFNKLSFALNLRKILFGHCFLHCLIFEDTLKIFGPTTY